MKLERNEFKTLAKAVGISAGVAAAIPIIIWVTGQVGRGAGGPDGLSSPGAVIMIVLALALGVLIVPWRPFFGWGFLYSHWVWFAGTDCLILGMIGGLWSVRRQRRAKLQPDADTSENPF